MEAQKEQLSLQKSLLPFDPVVLIRDAAKKWLLVLVVAVLAGILAYVYTDSVYIPVYRCEATMVLTTRGSSSTVYDNLDSTSSLATVFTEVLNSSAMRNNILDELQMDSFNGSIYASAVGTTNLLTIQVAGSDPRETFLMMRALLNKHELVTYAVMGDIVLEILEPPTVPIYPSNRMNSASVMKKAFVLAAALMFVLLVVMAYLRDVVRSKEEAEQKLDCWCLGEIHHEKKKRTIGQVLTGKKRSILITDPETGFRYVNTMNKLRRRVEKNMHHGKVLMITSVMENEGKSTVSTNLALAMAKKYKKVLLIDLDLYKPAVRKILEHEKPEHYVGDVIGGTVALEDAVKIDKLSRLNVLFAKSSKADEASQLISSPGLAAMLQEARELYDYVLIDLPPMSLSPEPEAVMEYTDASLLVIRQNGVFTTDLNRAIADLQRGDAKLLGCVLNNVYATEILSGEGYGTVYGRYGGYGRYGRYGKYGRYGVYAQMNSEE